MKAADSFAAYSFGESTHHVFCSAVIAVPAAVVVKTLRNVESIKRYGLDGGVIGSCVMENLVDPTDVGAVRRCTLRLPLYREKLIREKLTHYQEYRQKSSWNPAKPNEEELTKVEITLEYLPCMEIEHHRSPFEPVVAASLARTQTHIRISVATRAPHRCVVEMDAECVLRVQKGRHVSSEAKLQEKDSERAILEFWRQYLDGQLSALEQQVLKEAFPEVETRLDADFRTAFSSHEELLCDWAVDTSASLPRHVAVDELEKVLVWWARALEAYRQQKSLTEMAEARATRAEPPPFTLSRTLPHRFTEAERMKTTTRRHSESIPKAGPGVSESNNVSDSTQASHSGIDVPMPGFVLPRTFDENAEASNAFLRSGSRGPATIFSDTSRQSVMLPPDRRHTAVPKKSLVSAAALPDSGVPAKALSPAASFLAATNGANTLNSNALQTSFLSHSSRRKSMVSQQPHLLQHAQRRLSNMNSFSNSASRQSVQSATSPRVAPGNATGLFFSQFLTAPGYSHSTTAAAGTASGAAPQRTAPANASGVTSPLPPSRTSIFPAASAATQAPPAPHHTTLAAPQAPETFQPDMVRQLFSLTGVLREDVARRIFLALCSQDGASRPCLTSEGLKSVLRYLDPCGVREGSSLHRGSAAASDDAYRAEVLRCYHEQNLNRAPVAGAVNTRTTNSGDPSRTDQSSKLSHLTAVREATLRESDEVALDKLVQSLLSRFAFHKKRALSYEEFQLALLYLWNN